MTHAAPPPKGANLYRCYLLNIDDDPLNPGVGIVYVRGDAYPETQAAVRGVISKKPESEGMHLYLDEACEQVTEFGDPWTLTLLRKVREPGTRQTGGLDREWVKITLAREDLSMEEKLELIKKHT